MKRQLQAAPAGAAVPQKGEIVFAHYAGRLQDGSVFDSTKEPSFVNGETQSSGFREACLKDPQSLEAEDWRMRVADQGEED